MQKLSQETIAILAVGVAVVAVVLTTAGDLRDDMRAIQAESRAEREAIREEARAERETIRKESRAERETIREESRAAREADREEARANRERFERELLRITERYGLMNGLVEGLLRAVETGLGPPERGPDEPGAAAEEAR